LRDTRGQVANWLRRHTAEIRVAIRATVAAVLSYALATLFGLPQPYWSVIASLLVIQATVGASLQSSLDWLIGTIGGAIYGSIVGWLIPHDDPYAAGLALAFALAPLAFLAAINGRYRIAPVTAVVALIVPRGPDIDAVTFTLERTAEIGIGALIAVAVALLVLPARAHGLLAEAASRVLDAIAGLLPMLAARTVAAHRDDAKALAAFADVREKMAALDGAAEEARRERQIRLTDDPDPDALVWSVIRTRNDAIVLFRATSRPLPGPIAAELGPIVDAAAAAAAAHIREAAAAFSSRKSPPAPDGFGAVRQAYALKIEALRASGEMRALPTEVVEQLFSLAFALEQLHHDLIELCRQCAAYARPPVIPPRAEAEDA
jgi:uncharacterized membrane protein YccC